MLTTTNLEKIKDVSVAMLYLEAVNIEDVAESND